MLVRNLNGTAQNKCKCGNWLAHWERYSNQNADHCVVIGCNKKDLVGAHIQKDNAFDSSWYIIPICNSCNGKKGQALNIVNEVNLVSANVSETCG